ncbi:MAG: hypothetical protein KC503_32485 [Myxococcales bacterium]|nr:hypothetical protein [Myxococcales bacterium]
MSYRARSMLAAALALLVAGLAGCAGTNNFTPGDGGDAQRVDGVPVDQRVTDVPVVFACDTVDILFVIDNSNSMEQEQKNLIANFSKFIQRIEAIDPPIKSYHVGVVSTDLGAGPYRPAMNCVAPGDNGLLQNAASPACAGKTFPAYLTGPGPNVASDFACIAELGVGGCGYEQQMEAALVALTAQPQNAGFLRANAPLAVIFITDEDDCSAADPKIYDPDDITLGDLRTRCVAHTDKLHAVSRYVNAFKQLKASNPDRVVVAAITGPKAPVTIDPSVPGGVKPACSSTELGDAAPGNRFAQLVEAFGQRGVQQSLCDGDLAPALDVVAQAIERACLK